MWRMPIESAPHERTWMAFPREGVTLGEGAETREEGYRAWTEVAHAVAQFEPVTMVVDPTEIARARRMLSADVEIVEAPLDEFWMRDVGPTFVVDPERPACSAPSTGSSTAGAPPTGPSGGSRRSSRA